MASKSVFMTATSALTMLSIALYKRQSDASASAFIAAAVIVNLALMWCYHAYIYPRFVSKLKDIPITSGYHWLGANTFNPSGPFTCDKSRKWVLEAETELVRFFDLRHVEHVMPVSPAALQELLATRCYDFEKPSFLKSGSNLEILGDGLLFAEGDNHKRQRKQLTPAFSYRHIKDLVPLFWSISTHLVRAVEAERDSMKKAVVLPNVWTSRATLDIIGEAGLGKPFEALDAPERGVAKAYGNLFELDTKFAVYLRLSEFVIPSWALRLLPLKPIKQFVDNMQAIRGTCREMVLEKQANKRKTADTPAVDILSAILSESEVSFTNTQIEEHLLTFLAAGHETTAAAMSWALLALCKYPDIQKRLRDEIWTQVDSTAWSKDSDTGVTAAHIDEMPYLQAFCNEVLRLFPPVPMTIREAVVDTSLAGHPIPKGTAVVVAIWGTNANPALWGPDAAEFRPERWLDSPSGGCKTNYAFQTFIAGPRSCIGMSFAKHEFQCLVAAWVGRLETRLPPGEEEPRPHVVAGISAKPMPGWKVEVEVVERH